MGNNSIRVNSLRGKYVKKGSLEAVGVCDYSGFWFSHSDLVKQMEYRGNSLVWTGFMVGKPFVDIPNQQERPPLVKADPYVVLNPRPMGLESGDGPDAPDAPIILDELNNIVSSEPLAAPENMPTLAGQDVSKINANERLRLLHEVIW
jgi:hypothetical protein